jgi:hypothetical protein
MERPDNASYDGTRTRCAIRRLVVRLERVEARSGVQGPPESIIAKGDTGLSEENEAL